MGRSSNVYRHGYEDVAAKSVWKTVQTELKPLYAVIEAELS
jgi:hypothetical protein